MSKKILARIGIVAIPIFILELVLFMFSLDGTNIIQRPYEIYGVMDKLLFANKLVFMGSVIMALFIGFVLAVVGSINWCAKNK